MKLEKSNDTNKTTSNIRFTKVDLKECCIQIAKKI